MTDNDSLRGESCQLPLEKTLLKPSHRLVLGLDVRVGMTLVMLCDNSFLGKSAAAATAINHTVDILTDSGMSLQEYLSNSSLFMMRNAALDNFLCLQGFAHEWFLSIRHPVQNTCRLVVELVKQYR